MYSPKFETALLLVVFSFSVSAALQCYYCEYVEGATNSDCKSNLRDEFLYDVPPYPAPRSSTNSPESSRLVQMFNVTSPKAVDDSRTPLCEKVSGESVVGQEIIVRSGTYGPASYVGTCQNVSGGDGITATACWCDTDGCNNAVKNRW